MESLLTAVDIVRDENFEDQDDSADYDDGDEHDGEPVAKKQRSRKEEIQWTEQKEYVLVCAYKAEMAYMKTKGLNMERKRLLAFTRVKEHVSFRNDGNALTPGGVQAKFSRLEKAVTSKYALTGEGANLSGLPEKPPRVDEALYKMIKEKLTSTVQVSKGKQKEIDRSIRLKKHTDVMLQNMVRDRALNPSLVPAPPTTTLVEPTAATTTSVVVGDPFAVDRSESVSDATTSSLSSASSPADIIEEKWLALMTKREERRAAQSNEPSLQATMIELERKRVQMEEQRLRMEEQRIQIDKMNAENNRRLYELFAHTRALAYFLYVVLSGELKYGMILKVRINKMGLNFYICPLRIELSRAQTNPLFKCWWCTCKILRCVITVHTN